MSLLNFDPTLKAVEINGQYLLTTTAGKIYYAAENARRFMIEVIDLGTDSTVKTFKVQGDGIILVNPTVSIFRTMYLSQKNDFKFRRLS